MSGDTCNHSNIDNRIDPRVCELRRRTTTIPTISHDVAWRYQYHCHQKTALLLFSRVALHAILAICALSPPTACLLYTSPSPRD
eukprot:4600141-Alexandrium_andersonii.AAC.1